MIQAPNGWRLRSVPEGGTCWPVDENRLDSSISPKPEKCLSTGDSAREHSNPTIAHPSALAPGHTHRQLHAVLGVLVVQDSLAEKRQHRQLSKTPINQKPCPQKTAIFFCLILSQYFLDFQQL